MAKQNPKDFIFSNDFATTKQLLDSNGEPIIFTGTLTLSSSASEAHANFTIPNKQIVTRVLTKPSTVNKWFIGTPHIISSASSWVTDTSLCKIDPTTLQLKWVSVTGGHSTMTMQYKIYLFLSPFETS